MFLLSLACIYSCISLDIYSFCVLYMYIFEKEEHSGTQILQILLYHFDIEFIILKVLRMAGSLKCGKHVCGLY